MIIRIMAEGQFELEESAMDDLNRHDDQLLKAVESGDEASFKSALDALCNAVKTKGSAMAEDFLGPSDFVLPAPDATIEEVKALLSEEGLLPG